jgi:hypothetical protein
VLGNARFVRFGQAFVTRQQGQLEQFEAELRRVGEEQGDQHAVRAGLVAQRFDAAPDDAIRAGWRRRFDQAGERGLETAGDLPQRRDRRARFAAFDLAEHGLADAGLLRRPVEAPAASAAQQAQGVGDLWRFGS